MQRITTKNATKVCCWEGVISLPLRESEDDQISETQPGHKSLMYHTMDGNSCSNWERWRFLKNFNISIYNYIVPLSTTLAPSPSFDDTFFLFLLFLIILGGQHCKVCGNLSSPTRDGTHGCGLEAWLAILFLKLSCKIQPKQCLIHDPSGFAKCPLFLYFFASTIAAENFLFSFALLQR